MPNQKRVNRLIAKSINFLIFEQILKNIMRFDQPRFIFSTHLVNYPDVRFKKVQRLLAD